MGMAALQVPVCSLGAVPSAPLRTGREPPLPSGGGGWNPRPTGEEPVEGLPYEERRPFGPPCPSKRDPEGPSSRGPEGRVTRQGRPNGRQAVAVNSGRRVRPRW